MPRRIRTFARRSALAGRTALAGSAALAIILATAAHAVISPFATPEPIAPTDPLGTSPAAAPVTSPVMPAPEAPATTPVMPVQEAPAEAAPVTKPAPIMEPQPVAKTVRWSPRLRLWTIQDPNKPGANKSVWESNAGLVDATGKDRSAVRLQKWTGTFTDSGAGAEVMGVKGMVLTELGFDTRNDGYTGPGTPRFSVYLEDGRVYFFSHRQGGVLRPSTPAPGDPTNWTRFRFRDEDAYVQHRGQAPWPGFGNVRVKEIDIVFDEGLDRGKGYTYIDNVDINGTLIGSPTQ